ncbi:adenylate/guanylate cyclase domain-containing protein [Lacinutrix sp. Hel_I_90]|uniref:adenylate/guanylate cyclase domain-containing protein n=1 Tax=Lacinutrix sp. Hel_I_90 TaxID=1249999 RepID=UPI0005CB1575|nr:adenylate/guanylate cyclase domain-containing protein [Lacinutrix sp. Hel_I_90]
MKTTTFQFLRLLITTCIFWTLAFCVFIFIRYYAIGAEEGVTVTDYSISKILYYGVLLGLFIGTLFAIIEFLFDKLLSRNLSLGVVLLQKFVIYFIGIILSVNYIFKLAEDTLDLNLTIEEGWWKNSKIFWLLVCYFIICSLIYSFIRIANEKFGRGVFFNFLIGKYRKPREEKRIFMFVDLQASTTIAEDLGHYQYSRLIQECFNDLNGIVRRYDANIYQYVGDEAVLSWSFKKGLRNDNCVNLYYHFQNRINRKSKIYKKKYGLVPKFKAGVHGGKLIVTEVGTVKKEIAYHGDVINTTARIQGECNKYNEWFLISDELLNQLSLSTNYKTKAIGDVNLKGREETLNISAISRV